MTNMPYFVNHSLKTLYYLSMRIITFFLLLVIAGSNAQAQQKTSGTWWRAQLHRQDGQNIVFNFEWTTEKGKPVWYIRNAAERLRVNNIKEKGDSLRP